MSASKRMQDWAEWKCKVSQQTRGEICGAFPPPGFVSYLELKYFVVAEMADEVCACFIGDEKQDMALISQIMCP